MSRDRYAVRQETLIVHLEDLPEAVQTVCKNLVHGLKRLLGEQLYGAYMYGAAVFPDSGRVQDIDCHIIIESPLDDGQRAGIAALHADLAKRFPPLGAEVDAYYVLRNDAEASSPPINQNRPPSRDESWALHCAHVRAGYYIALDGPPAMLIFPSPTWQAISDALDCEFAFVREHFQAPAYCVLNLCRIIYTRSEHDPVVSKHFAGNWARNCYPEWAPLIEAALRSYERTATPEEADLLRDQVGGFFAFASARIHERLHSQ